MRPIRPVPHQRRPLQPLRPNYDLNEAEFTKPPIEVRPAPSRSRTRRLRRACGPLGPRYLCTVPGRLLGKGAVRLVSWHWDWAATGVLAMEIHVACIAVMPRRHIAYIWQIIAVYKTQRWALRERAARQGAVARALAFKKQNSSSRKQLETPIPITVIHSAAPSLSDRHPPPVDGSSTSTVPGGLRCR